MAAGLPADGNLSPSRTEQRKLAALDPVFEFHGRLGIVDVRVVDVAYAFVGLHGRTVLLITREPWLW